MLSLLPLEFRSQKSASEIRSWFRFEDICDEGLTLRHLARLSHREGNEQGSLTFSPPLKVSGRWTWLGHFDLLVYLGLCPPAPPPLSLSPQIMSGHEKQSRLDVVGSGVTAEERPGFDQWIQIKERCLISQQLAVQVQQHYQGFHFHSHIENWRFPQLEPFWMFLSGRDSTFSPHPHDLQ